MKTSAFVATSRDGYIARSDGAVDWLGPSGDEGNEDYGFAAFMDSVDILVMGRNSYDTVIAIGEWPYGDTPVIVLTHRPIEIPAELAHLVEAREQPPIELAEELALRGVDHVYVDGVLSSVIGQPFLISPVRGRNWKHVPQWHGMRSEPSLIPLKEV